MGSADEHCKNQQEFWMALINKYEKRNLMLEQQILSLQTQLEHPDINTKQEQEYPLSKKDSTCSCSPCTQKTAKEGDESSVCSLGSTDLQLMSQIKDLVDREKLAKQKLVRLQQQAFVTKIEMSEECRCSEYSAINNTLLAENNRLTNELKDLKAEMKQYIEKIKGPITREIEKEKSNNKCLETEIERISKNIENMQQKFLSETSELKSKLSKINQELTLISAINRKLEEELVSQNEKCKELEEALIRQKKGEADIYRTIKAAELDGDKPTSPGFHGDTKKRFSLTPDDYKRFPCYPQYAKPNDAKQVAKSTISEKPMHESCTCQTQKEMKNSMKVQAKPDHLEASASAVPGKVDIQSTTDKNAVEQIIATEEIVNQDNVAETTLQTAEGC